MLIFEMSKYNLFNPMLIQFFTIGYYNYITKLGIEFDLNKRHIASIMSVEEILNLVFEENGVIKEKKRWCGDLKKIYML